MKMAIAGMLCVAGTLLGIGCSGIPPMKATLLDMRDNGTTIQAVALDRLIVSLPATPSAGYSWQVTGGDTNVVMLEEQKFVPESAQGVGVPGIQVMVFLVQGAGTTTMTLGYFPPGASQPANTFSLTVQATE